MTDDDTPVPDIDAAADSADAAYQAGFNAGNDALAWIAAGLSILTAEIDAEDWTDGERKALARLRCATMGRMGRIVSGDIGPAA
jgi:hypothetical protein